MGTPRPPRDEELLRRKWLQRARHRDAPTEAGRLNRPEVAVGGVARRGDEILLVRRGNPPGLGQWSIPGGRVRAGETLSEAVEREMAEETGLEVHAGTFLGLVERLGDEPMPYHFVILDFLVDPVDPSAEPRAGSDAREAAWVPRDQLSDLDLVDGLLEFFREYGLSS